MNNPAQKKPDYLFVASLIAIIFVAIYLAMDRFKESPISDYLKGKGQLLLAQIDNLQERDSLQSEYDKFIEKVEKRQIDPQKVEQFASTILNLDLAREKLKGEEFAYILQKNLQEAAKADTVKRAYQENNERWQKLQERLQNIDVFENKIKQAEKVKPASQNNFSFSYTIDDTLNIIINEQYKDNLIKNIEIAGELNKLEKEKTLKWQKETETIMKEHQALQHALEALKEVNAAVSVIASKDDSLKVKISTGAIKVESPAPLVTPGVPKPAVK